MKHDFSRVRVHKDNEAVQMNRQLDARAFTHGMDIYFGGGQFDPGSLEGKRLLAHELTHLVQQSASQGGKLHFIQRFEAGPPTEPDLEDLGEAGNEFDENHQDLTERERLKIHSALRNILQRYDPHYRRYERNLHLWIDYLNYYSSHPLEKATDDDIVDWGENELARTRGSVTTLRPSVFGLSNITLGGVLIHEFTHTRHRTIVGMQHQEGEAYGIEFFFAERTNNLERMARILPFYQDPSSVGVTPNSINAFRRLFHIYGRQGEKETNIAEIKEVPAYYAEKILEKVGLNSKVWYSSFTEITFLGQRVGAIHTDLVAHLKVVEKKIAATHGGDQQDPKVAGHNLNLNEAIGSARCASVLRCRRWP